MINKKIKRLMLEYKTKKNLYSEFSEAVKYILDNILTKNSLKYQTIFPRAKEEQSLFNKLKKNNIKTLENIKDLAGCRIIFYLEADIKRCLTYLYKEFNIVDSKLKYSKDNYNAYHIIIKLKKDRLKLAEYSKFKNLKCEIQLTTVLYHAWSELAHDIIYKEELSISKFDIEKNIKIKARFENTMSKYLKEAQDNFDFIFKQIEQIKQGKEIFNTDFINTIVSLHSNDKIYQKLKLLSDQLEEFGNKIPQNCDIIKILITALKNSKNSKEQSILGYNSILNICLKIMEDLRFVYMREIIDVLLILSIEKNNEKEVKDIFNVISKISEYAYNKKDNKIYYHLQYTILDKIEKFNNNELLTYFDFILTVTRNMLSTSFDYTYMKDSKSFCFSKGIVPASDSIKNIRNRNMNILKKLYSLTKRITNKEKILSIFSHSVQLDLLDSANTQGIVDMILIDSNNIIRYYLDIIINAENEILMQIDKQIHWFPKECKLIVDLKENLYKNSDYMFYKIFVGYDYDFSEDFDSQKAEQYRDSEIDRYINTISKNNFIKWQNKILMIIKNYENNNDSGKFMHFNRFLRKLGESKPKLAMQLLSNIEQKIHPFLFYLISGIWNSNQKNKIKRIILIWIKQNKNLSLCAEVMDRLKDIDKIVLERVYQKAKEKKDLNAITQIISAITSNFRKINFGKKIYIDCIRILTEFKNYCWVNHVSFIDNYILETLNVKEVNTVLSNMVYVPQIDIAQETILSIISKRNPKQVINFLYKRMLLETKSKNNGLEYNSIPFHFYELHKPLKEHTNIVINEIFKLFIKDKSLDDWKYAKLISTIFPKFNQELEYEMIKFMKEKNIEFIILILRNYKGELFIHNICKEIIKRYGKKYYNNLFIILSQTGVVCGEYGFVEAYKQKKKEIQEWKKDNNKVINIFINKYEEFLDKQIDYETKRAEENIQVRKFAFES